MSVWKYSWQLIKVGYGSMFKNHNDLKAYTVSNIVTFIGIPMTVIVCGFLSKFSIEPTLVSDILTILSIFLAITLGVIFIVPDKLSKRLESDKSENESDRNDRRRYKNFCKLFVQRLSFVLILCVAVIVLTLIMKLFPNNPNIILSSLIIGLFILSILCILKLIVDIYLFLMNDLSEITNQEKN